MVDFLTLGLEQGFWRGEMEASGGEAELRFSEHRRRLACVGPGRGEANFRTAVRWLVDA